MKKLLTVACMVALICACNQKQSVVSVPVTQIDVEKLIDSIDYDMDVWSLTGRRSHTELCAHSQVGFPLQGCLHQRHLQHHNLV